MLWRTFRNGLTRLVEQSIEKLHGLPLCQVYLAQSRVLSHANFRHVSGHYDSPRKGKNGSFLAIPLTAPRLFDNSIRDDEFLGMGTEMAMAGQMVKRSVTRCEICCEGNSPSTQFGGEKGDFPIAGGVVRGAWIIPIS